MRYVNSSFQFLCDGRSAGVRERVSLGQYLPRDTDARRLVKAGIGAGHREMIVRVLVIEARDLVEALDQPRGEFLSHWSGAPVEEVREKPSRSAPSGSRQ